MELHYIFKSVLLIFDPILTWISLYFFLRHMFHTETVKWQGSCRILWVETAGPPSSSAVLLLHITRPRANPPLCLDRGENAHSCFSALSLCLFSPFIIKVSLVSLVIYAIIITTLYIYAKIVWRERHQFTAVIGFVFAEPRLLRTRWFWM